MKDWKLAKKMAKRWGGTPAANYAALKAVGAPTRTPQLAPSAQTALAELARTEEVLKAGGNGDRLAAAAQHDRAVTAVGIELVKAARSRPTAFGDDAMVAFLRGGRR